MPSSGKRSAKTARLPGRLITSARTALVRRDGDKDSMKRTTNQLTSRFRSLFRHVELPDMKEHDLRHEACCRWFELRGKDGRWVFSDVEICKIMGWSDYSMVLRYASLRGEDLSSRLSAM